MATKKINFGKGVGNKKMLGNAKSPHKAKSSTVKKKIKENEIVTFKDQRRVYLSAMLEGMIEGDEGAVLENSKKYLSLKSHQIITEKDDDDAIDGEEEKLDKLKDDLVDDEDMEDEDGEDEDENDEDMEDEDDSKLFKTKKSV